MEVYYKELLENKEELERKIANVASEDTVDLIETLNMLRRRAGANHPLTIAYETGSYEGLTNAPESDCTVALGTSTVVYGTSEVQ